MRFDWLSHARPAQFPFPLFLFPVENIKDFSLCLKCFQSLTIFPFVTKIHKVVDYLQQTPLSLKPDVVPLIDQVVS